MPAGEHDPDDTEPGIADEQMGAVMPGLIDGGVSVVSDCSDAEDTRE